jgi:DNA-directed RNA polymerase subunit RPC12/RpoP
MNLADTEAQENAADEDNSSSDQDDAGDIAYSIVDKGNVKQRVYHCRFCPTSSKRKTYIYVHEQMHNMSSEESFNCSQCDFSSKNSSTFLHLAHLASHAEENNAQKSLKRGFDQAEAGSSSKMVDSASIKPGKRRMFSYVCPNCPAAFKSPGDLKIHTVFHGDVDYEHRCPYCNYRAKNNPQLCKHFYVHTADYISKRANSYPDGTKFTIGHSDKDVPAPPPLYHPANNK